MIESVTGLRGMRNYLNAQEYYALEQIFWHHSYLYGVQPIKLSTIQPVEWFTSTSGEASDIVNKEMISAARYIDKKDIGILCPEYTGPFVKLLNTSGGPSHTQQSRFGYFASAYRYNRPQAGRFREFTQCGWEFFGIQNSEAEVILGASELLKYLGWQDAILKINNIGTEEDQRAYAKILVNYFTNKDISDDARYKLQHSPLRILDIDDLGYDIPEYKISESSQQRFTKLLSELTDLGIKYHVSHKLVRGLDYYEETVFEFHSDKDQAILAGGRYDRITSDWQHKTQAIGWAAGIERLLERPLECNKSIWLLDMDGSALNTATELRAGGIPITRYITNDLKSWLSKAQKAQIEWVIIIGENEQQSQTLSWKNFKTTESGNCTKEAFIKLYIKQSAPQIRSKSLSVLSFFMPHQ